MSGGEIRAADVSTGSPVIAAVINHYDLFWSLNCLYFCTCQSHCVKKKKTNISLATLGPGFMLPLLVTFSAQEPTWLPHPELQKLIPLKSLLFEE